MMATQIGDWHYRWFASTTTLVASRNPDCFDSAFEPSVRRFHVTNWLDVGNRSIPVVNVNGHTAADIVAAFREPALAHARKEGA